MLDSIINLVKKEALGAITNNADIPADKKDAAVETTTSTIVDSFKDQLGSGNISNIMGLFSGDSGSSSSFSNSIQSSVISALTEKVGLNKGIANTIASTVIPAVMAMISKKNNDSNDSFSIESLVKSVSGGDNGGGILGTLGKLFGK